MNGDIGWSGLATSLVLVVVAIGLSAWRRLDLERSIAWASARAIVQLLAIGWILQILFESNQSLAWSWLWVMMMVLFAAETVRRRATRGARRLPARAGGVRGRGCGEPGCALRARRVRLERAHADPTRGIDDRQLDDRDDPGGPAAVRGAARQASRGRGAPGARSGVVRGGASLRAPRAAHRARSRRSRRRKRSGSSSCRVR